jgi:hypothetical protein
MLRASSRNSWTPSTRGATVPSLARFARSVFLLSLPSLLSWMMYLPFSPSLATDDRCLRRFPHPCLPPAARTDPSNVDGCVFPSLSSAPFLPLMKCELMLLLTGFTQPPKPSVRRSSRRSSTTRSLASKGRLPSLSLRRWCVSPLFLSLSLLRPMLTTLSSPTVPLVLVFRRRKREVDGVCTLFVARLSSAARFCLDAPREREGSIWKRVCCTNDAFDQLLDAFATRRENDGRQGRLLLVLPNNEQPHVDVDHSDIVVPSPFRREARE